MKPLVHPPHPGSNASFGDQQLYRIAAQMIVLENSRPHAVEEVMTDMDSKSLVWRKCETEWLAVCDLLAPTNQS